MQAIVTRVGAAYAILAVVTATIATAGAMPAQAQSADLSCAAIDAEIAHLSDPAAAAADADAAKKSARKHMMLGFAKTMATSMLPFGGMIGQGGLGGVASVVGQAAAQASLTSSGNSAARPAASQIDGQQRLAQLGAMSAARGCTPA